MESKKNDGIMHLPTFVTARRAISLNKTYVGIAIFIAILALTAWNPNVWASKFKGTSNSTINAGYNGTTGQALNGNQGLPLLSIPFYAFPPLMLVTPIVVLFVYDKNNGVLEYLLSLGMTQRDIYLRYLKASLLLVAIYFVIFTIVDIAYSYAFFTASATSTLFIVLPIAIVIIMSVVAFMITMMMTFSSLQRTRIGSNQPLAMLVGVACTIPGYIIPLALPFNIALVAEILEAVMLAVTASVFIIYSGKLIKREKFLP